MSEKYKLVYPHQLKDCKVTMEELKANKKAAVKINIIEKNNRRIDQIQSGKVEGNAIVYNPKSGKLNPEWAKEIEELSEEIEIADGELVDIISDIEVEKEEAEERAAEKTKKDAEDKAKKDEEARKAAQKDQYDEAIKQAGEFAGKRQYAEAIEKVELAETILPGLPETKAKLAELKKAEKSGKLSSWWE